LTLNDALFGGAGGNGGLFGGVALIQALRVDLDNVQRAQAKLETPDAVGPSSSIKSTSHSR